MPEPVPVPKSLAEQPAVEDRALLLTLRYSAHEVLIGAARFLFSSGRLAGIQLRGEVVCHGPSSRNPYTRKHLAAWIPSSIKNPLDSQQFAAFTRRATREAFSLEE